METKITITTTKTYEVKWIKESFLAYSDKFKKIRSRMGYKASNCFKCRHPFNIDEMLALACLTKVGNKVLCQKCATEILEREKSCTTKKP